MFHLKQILLMCFILNIMIEDSHSKLFEIAKIVKKVFDATCHEACNNANYFKNYCCFEGIFTDLEPCCNMFKFIFKNGFDQQNFSYAIKNPRLINIALVVAFFIIIFSIIGTIFKCCRRQSKPQYIFMNTFPSPTSNA
jgi:hypothetical protein